MSKIVSNLSEATQALLTFKSLEPVLKKYLDSAKDGSVLTEIYNVGGTGAAKRLFLTERAMFLFSGKDLFRIDHLNLNIEYKKSGSFESFKKGVSYVSLKDGDEAEAAATFLAGKCIVRSGLGNIEYDPECTQGFAKFLQSYVEFLKLGLKDYGVSYAVFFRKNGDQLTSKKYLKYGPQEMIVWNDEKVFLIEDEFRTVPKNSLKAELINQNQTNLIQLEFSGQSYYVAAYKSEVVIDNAKTVELFNKIFDKQMSDLKIVKPENLISERLKYRIVYSSAALGIALVLWFYDIYRGYSSTYYWRGTSLELQGNYLYTTFGLIGLIGLIVDIIIWLKNR